MRKTYYIDSLSILIAAPLYVVQNASLGGGGGERGRVEENREDMKKRKEKRRRRRRRIRRRRRNLIRTKSTLTLILANSSSFCCALLLKCRSRKNYCSFFPRLANFPSTELKPNKEINNLVLGRSLLKKMPQKVIRKSYI